MIFVIISILIASTAIGTSLYLKKKPKPFYGIRNEELDKFYSMFNESSANQIKQLVLAAQTTMRNVKTLTEKSGIINELYNERLLSETYYKQFKSMEEDLVIEKTMIENEVDMLRPDFKEMVFAEAAKRMANDSIFKTKKQKMFDEALFLKKQDLLIKNLKSRLMEEAK